MPFPTNQPAKTRFTLARYFIFILALAAQMACQKKDASNKVKFAEKTLTENGFTYTTVEGDPTQTRIYTLSNGLKVYLSVYKDMPRISTFIVVKAGSRNDPPTATGLAHYLEHMVFKGTSKMGADQWDKEKPLLDSIEHQFEVYRKTTDPAQRKKLYALIDKTSSEAAKFAIANEYDKIMANLGAEGTNAFTDKDHTAYVNDIPSNSFDKWIEVEAERFNELVPRLFHTELEAVYEEKNRGLDNDVNKMYEQMGLMLNPTHPYGTQTTIGTIEHLKNPSITEIKKYFYKYYIPNNMAICLSGDFDPDHVIHQIDKNWGHFKKADLAKEVFPVEAPISQIATDTVYGPKEEQLLLGFRFAGAKSDEAEIAGLISDMLYNGQAGLMDINLVQKQKVLTAWCYINKNNDYSAHYFGGKPRAGQSLTELKELILAQLDSIKQGHFPDWMLAAVINNRKANAIRENESNQNRAYKMLQAFSADQSWLSVVNENDKLSKLTRQQVIDFAKTHYNNNYAVVYKLTGEDKSLVKVEKPAITPVPINRDKTSAFMAEITSRPSKPLQPVFLDFKTDLQQVQLPSKANIVYKKNVENGMFTMYYLFETGTENDPKLALAAKYLQYLGAGNFGPEALQQEFYKLGSSFFVYTAPEQIYVAVNGLEENFDKTLPLFEALLNEPQANETALQNLVSDNLKQREDAKKDKDKIRYTLNAYAKFGPKNPANNVLSDAELKALKPDDLLGIIKKLPTWQHDILYYGPRELPSLTETLKTLHRTPASLEPVPKPVEFKPEPFEKNKVYFVNFDMVQAEITFISASGTWERTLQPKIQLYNEYFGGSMGSIVFTELRESKALAYSTNSTFNSTNLGKPNFIISYIGSQADKLNDAIVGMNDILTNMPLAQPTFEANKKVLMERYQSERINKMNILLAYEEARKNKMDTDIRQEIYEGIKPMNLSDVKAFQEQYVKGKPYTLTVVANRNKIKLPDLKKYGEVKELTLTEIFGF